MSVPAEHNTINIGLIDESHHEKVLAAVGALGWEEVNWIAFIALMVVHVPEGGLADACLKAKSLEGVDAAFPNARNRRNPPVTKSGAD